MLPVISTLLACIAGLFRSRASLCLENLALRHQLGPTARKLRPDLIGNVTTYPSFPFHVWPWPFVTKMIEKEAVIPSIVAQKCRFRRIGEIRC
jgi:hypothetical protein